MTDYVVEFSGWNTFKSRAISESINRSSYFFKKKRYSNMDILHVLPQAKKDATEINAEVFSIIETKPTRYLGTWEKKSGRWYLAKE